MITMGDWHSLKESEVLEQLKTRKEGLSSSEASDRLGESGYNELVEKRAKTPVSIFLDQFKSFLILILIVATILSFALGEFIDAIVILAVVLVNALLGFFQEYSAERAVAALKRMTAPNAVVIRNREKVEIHAREMVPGDIVFLEEGMRVPADMRLLSVAELSVDESSLTGESVPVPKEITVLKKGIQVADMRNMAFMGTYVTRGTATGVAVETGMRTQMGEIAKSVAEAESPQTPLQIRLGQLGRYLGVAVLVLASFIFILEVYAKQGTLLDLFLVAVALAISAIPEGLPAVVTLTLSIGMKRLAKKNAIVRLLLAVETLGTTSVICSDKTGTLTKNEMTIQKVYVDDEFLDVSGRGFEPVGQFSSGGKVIEPEKRKDLVLLAKAGALCNNASIEKTESGWRVIGDPTEGSLIVLASKTGLELQRLKKDIRLVTEVPFSSERKMMSTAYKETDGVFVYAKGAPEVILKRCDQVIAHNGIRRLTDREEDKLTKAYKELAKNAFRVLAVAYKKLPDKTRQLNVRDIESGLTFVGIVGMRDPPRDGVKEAIKKAKDAGIKTVMLTGDNELTAAAIAKQLDIMKPGELVITGTALDKMSIEELDEVVERTSVFARISPMHKVKILQAFENKGQVVAMTGDGVNDAPAIKRADIGIAMGIKGTDVAKEASDMILADDHYATIVTAVEEGRGIYANIRKFIKLMLSVNFVEVFLIAMTAVAGLPLPLLPLQLLWINLVTDSFPALSLAVDPVEKEIMKKPPRKKFEGIFSGGMAQFLIAAAIIGTVAEVIIYTWGLNFGVEKARTLVLTLSVMFQMIFMFNCRSEEKPFFRVNPLSNKYLFVSVLAVVGLQLLVVYWDVLQPVFETVALNATDWTVIVLLSLLGTVISPSYFLKKEKNNTAT